MMDGQHKPTRSHHKVASDTNEFYLPPGTEKMVSQRYKEWLKKRGLKGTSTMFRSRTIP